MAFQRVPNTVQVDAIFSLFGQNVENVFHIQWPGGVDAVAIADSATAVRDWVEASYLPLLSNQIQFLRCEALNLDIDNGGTSVAFATGAGTGGTASASLPGGSAFCVSLRTAQSGRNHRGRKYVMGIPEAGRSGNQVTGAYRTQMESAFADLINDIQSVNAVLVVVSRFLNNVLRLEAIVTEVIAIVASDTNIDSQRRRLTGRGS